MNVIHLPIEKYPNRYTAEWCDTFSNAFSNSGINYVNIDPENVVEKINQGSVLDVFGTNLYKFKQMDTLLRLLATGEVNEDTIVFIADLWFPGLESLFYVRNITGINFKIAGILHAGSYDPFDYTSRNGMRNWAQHVELSWITGVDMIFVATQWHKDLIVMNSGDFDKDKIFVTGLPFCANAVREWAEVNDPTAHFVKDNIVVFPHRLDSEKHPEKFDRLARKYPQWNFVKTVTYNLDRKEYFKMLARSKVMISFAEQETFGYSTLEAMALGCHVIVPNSLSYRETVPKENRYNKESEIQPMLQDFMMRTETKFYPELEKWEKSIPNMIKVMNVKLKEASRKRQELENEIKEEQARVEAERKNRSNKEANE